MYNIIHIYVEIHIVFSRSIFRHQHQSSGAHLHLQMSLWSHPQKGSNKNVIQQSTKPINVEEHISKQELQTWSSNKHFALLNEDCQILLNPVGWLNSSLIPAAQILLREKSGAKAGLAIPSNHTSKFVTFFLFLFFVNS